MGSSKILVIGASGTNGQELLKQLSKNNIAVKAFVRDKNNYKGIKNDKVELIEGDLSKPDTINKALKKITTAYFVTAIHSDSVNYCSNFISAANEQGVKNIIKISALGADLNSSSEILRQHAESDLMLINSTLNYTILRPNSFYQNMLWESRQIKRRGKFSLPLANAKQSLVDIRDIAEVTVELCKAKCLDNQIYNLTGSEPISYVDVANQLSEVLQKPVKYIAINSDVSQQGMKSIGMPDWNVRVLSELQTLFAEGKFSDVSNDLKLLLGREPRSFSDFARSYATSF